MSIISSTMFGGAYGFMGPMYQLADDAPPIDNQPELGGTVNPLAAYKMPKPTGPIGFDEALRRQTGEFGNPNIPLNINGTPCSWSPGGGLAFNRLGFRLYQTYRAMDDDATLNLARHMTIDPILAGNWTVEGIDKTVNPDWIDLIRRQVLPHLPIVLPHALRSLSFGWQPFEKVWEINDGELWCRLRPMYPDYSIIYLGAATKQYADISFGGTVKILPPNKSLIITHNGEATDLYGHSKHDAAYEAYCQWKRTEFDLIKLRSKISGILPTLMYPPGTTPGSTVDNSVLANQILQTLSIGYGVAMPAMQYTAQEIARNPRLANISPWQLTIHDTGSLSPAIEGYLKVMAKYDVDKFRAWSLPERTGMEGSHGTKAESGVHSDNAITTKELIAQEVAYQLTHGNPTMGVQGWIDDILRYNFGEKAVGTVELKMGELADNKLGFKAELLQQILSCNNPALVEAFLKIISVENTVAQLGIPLAGDATFVSAFEQAKAAIKADQTEVPDPQPTITPPGGPKGPAKVAAALQMASAA